MKRAMTVLVLAAAAGLAGIAVASEKQQGAQAAKAEAKPKATSLKGEIVDMGCYVAHEARGEKHKSCALKCIAGGMPMGLLTEGGTVYLLMLNHDNPDPFAKCKELAAAKVEITGLVGERGGIKAIDVQGVKPLAAAASGK